MKNREKKLIKTELVEHIGKLQYQLRIAEACIKIYADEGNWVRDDGGDKIIFKDAIGTFNPFSIAVKALAEIERRGREE